MTPFLKLLYSFSHGRKAHGRIDGVGALHRDGRGGKAALRGGLKVRAVEERAGDAFMAALAWAYLEGTDLGEAAAAASAAASIAVEGAETINSAMSATAIRSRMAH